MAEKMSRGLLFFLVTTQFLKKSNGREDVSRSSLFPCHYTVFIEIIKKYSSEGSESYYNFYEIPMINYFYAYKQAVF